MQNIEVQMLCTTEYHPPLCTDSHSYEIFKTDMLYIKQHTLHMLRKYVIWLYANLTLYFIIQSAEYYCVLAAHRYSSALDKF